MTSNQLRLEECQENGKPLLALPLVANDEIPAGNAKDSNDVTQGETAEEIISFQEIDTEPKSEILSDNDNEQEVVVPVEPQVHRYALRGKVQVDDMPWVLNNKHE